VPLGRALARAVRGRGLDASRTYYGIVAREELALGSGGESVACGRRIRKAWLTGEAP
jgi:hypothetical protein